MSVAWLICRTLFYSVNCQDPAFDSQFQSRGGAEGARRTSVGTASSMRKASSSTNIVDDLSSIFGGDILLLSTYAVCFLFLSLFHTQHTCIFNTQTYLSC